MQRVGPIRPNRTRAVHVWLVLALLLVIGAERIHAEPGAEAPGMASVEGGEEVPNACPDGAAERAAKSIQARYEGIRDIHAKFRQTNRSASFEGEPFMASGAKTGNVVFAKPGKMRWSYLSPEPSIVVSDGSTLWIYDVPGESITRLEVTSGFLSGAALQFLLGNGRILETFEVRAVECDADRITLDLLPREEATYERLGLVADVDSGDVVATSVLDLFGNLTEIGFSEIQINRDPPPETFVLAIPDGVEVIDYAGSPEG